MKKLLVILFQCIVQMSYAQTFTIHKVEVTGENINLYYDLTDTDISRTYTITLFSSKDNYISPLTKVNGDIGLEIKPGGNKVISWNAREELGSTYEGDVALEVRGRIYVPFVRLDGLQRIFKRGVSNELTWTGGTQQNILNFDLYKGKEKITSFPNIANVGQYTITIPLSIRPGKGYHFKITDSKNKDQIVHSKEFRIKRKVPLLIKAVPLTALAGAIMLLTPAKKSDNSIPSAITPDNGI